MWPLAKIMTVEQIEIPGVWLNLDLIQLHVAKDAN